MAQVKMTGHEYNEFCNADCWGDDWYWDETLFRLNGVEVDDIGACEDTDEVILLEGTVYKGSYPNAPAIDALGFVRKWLKSRTVATVMVEVPKEQIAAFKADMEAKNLKVIG